MIAGRCQWFALCDHDAAGAVAHPILGLVPCCQRCADALGLEFDGSELEPLSASERRCDREAV